MSKFFAIIIFLLFSSVSRSQTVPDSSQIPDASIGELEQLISREDWVAVASKSLNYITKLRSDTSNLRAQLNFVFILASAAKTSQEEMSYDDLSKAVKNFVGKKVFLPVFTISTGKGPCFNFYCPGEDEYDVFSTATNQAGTYIFAFIYAKTGAKFDFIKNAGHHAYLKGTIESIKPNPNKSLALILRIYIKEASLQLID